MAGILDMLAQTDLSQPVQPEIRKPENGVANLLARLKNKMGGSVMQQGFVGGLTAPMDSPMNYDTLGSTVGNRLRTMIVDPLKSTDSAIRKGLSGQPLTPKDMASITDFLASYAVGGGLLSKQDPNKLNMFVGASSKEIKAAEKMAQSGISKELIHKELLMHKKPDGFWRKEISDASTKLNKHIEDGSVDNWDMGAFGINAEKTLPHPELYNQYPEIGQIQTSGKVRDSLSDALDAVNGATHRPAKGSYTEGGGIELNTPIDDMRSVMGHELQHTVQDKEGWSRGGSVREFRQKKVVLEDRITQINKDMGYYAKKLDETKKDGRTEAYNYFRKQYDDALDEKMSMIDDVQADPWDQYKNLLGEREARDTAKRMGLSLTERMSQLPDFGEGAIIKRR